MKFLLRRTLVLYIFTEQKIQHHTALRINVKLRNEKNILKLKTVKGLSQFLSLMP
ncbi:hypothetical protein BH10BAC2_BH10BAC2_21370 [soil metagenome]